VEGMGGGHPTTCQKLLFFGPEKDRDVIKKDIVYMPLGLKKKLRKFLMKD